MTTEIKDGENSAETEVAAAEVKAADHNAAAELEREQAAAAKKQRAKSQRAGGDTGSGVDLHNDNDEWPAGRARPPEIDGSFPNIQFDDPVVESPAKGKRGK